MALEEKLCPFLSGRTGTGNTERDLGWKSHNGGGHLPENQNVVSQGPGYIYTCKFLPNGRIYVCRFLSLGHIYVCRFLPLGRIYVCRFLPLAHFYVCRFLPLGRIYVCRFLPLGRIYVCRFLQIGRSALQVTPAEALDWAIVLCYIYNACSW